MFEKMTSDIVTFNAAMYQGDKRYKMAEQLAQKNIDNRVASDHDYVILVKARMAQENTPGEQRSLYETIGKGPGNCHRTQSGYQQTGDSVADAHEQTGKSRRQAERVSGPAGRI